MIEETTLPHNTEAENKIVATCVGETTGDNYNLISDLVTVDDFYTLRAKLLFRAIKSIHDSNKPIDDVAVMESVKAQGGWDELGGMVGFFAMIENVTTPLHLVECAKTVRNKSVLRKVIRASRIARERAESETADPDEIIGELEANLEATIRVSSNELDLSSATESIVTEGQKGDAGDGY